MIPHRHSIQWRIFAYYTGLICVSVGVLIGGFYVFEKKARIQAAKLEIQTKLVGMIPFYFSANSRPLADMRRHPGPGGPPMWGAEPGRDRAERVEDEARLTGRGARVDGLLRSLRSEQIYFYAESSDGEVLQRTDNFPDELLPDASSLGAEDQVWDFSETATQLYTVHSLRGRGTLIMGEPRSVLIGDLNALMLRVVGCALVLIILVSVVGFWLLRYSLRPIRKISETASRIAAGDISERIDTSEVHSELGEMAAVLNKTFGRLSEALTRQIQFTSDASHELRTPVAAILADCQFSLKRERSAERYRETIEVCHESAQHMRALIEDLRDLADFDEKTDSLVRESVEMKEFLANVVSVMKPIATEKGVHLESELDSAVVSLDPTRMRQAVLNILGNAVRYTEVAGRVIVRCIKKSNTVVIEVSDTGIGIPADKLSHIFDRFYRVDEARNAHTGGVGLGLAISKSIIEANDGQISVESEIGVGTCFRIELGV